ncbi:chemotaxis protein CheA [Marinibactrum halimedae]|uniref:Chemotaxis protein CheA n=1 Tax=Marinibactrum halimedae TaxID=1444977 RepID=A0AA37T1L3_9GAMM|nr:chemotaxis protein CheA [Marinibactrum halimedae]MCD9460309.1 chemotaxis protein CheA [Marinibactrum halimedae]GLS24399.1 chemotaxis protein CheA [Marinibactrum halimedae]
MSIDLSQFHQVFFEEALEGLDIMEQALLSIDEPQFVDDETINEIFRAAHSIKGGAATLGFTQISDFTHVLETLLDEIRQHKRTLLSEMVELFLKSCDFLRDTTCQLMQDLTPELTQGSELIAAFEKMLQAVEENEDSSDTYSEMNDSISSSVVAETFFGGMLNESRSSDEKMEGKNMAENSLIKSSKEEVIDKENELGNGAGDGKTWKIYFKPEPQILQTGNEPFRIFRELAQLGELEAQCHCDLLPDFEELVVDECFLYWTLKLTTQASRDEILDIFEWVIDECELTVELVSPEFKVDQSAAEEKKDNLKGIISEEAASEDMLKVNQSNLGATEEITSNGVTSGAKGDAATIVPLKESSVDPLSNKGQERVPLNSDESDSKKIIDKSKQKSIRSNKKEKEVVDRGGASASSIRVGIDKVDSLINLVGELVITQSMLSELGNDFDLDKLERLSNGLEQLRQNTRELQESVMKIRMLPISFAFNRFPRMIRDLSNKTGKKVQLTLKGEHTELDKTVMEQISDPLVHLVRNAIDHGIETPERRVALGKNEEGSIVLSACHQGGNIVVEVSDDGKGIDPEAILEKARDKNIHFDEAETDPQKIFDLIFEPGFSTAESISDISGRGVGMDVVRRNIKDLGGRIEVESKIGKGSVFRVYLPLTLAILDGQLVRVGDEVYVIPLVSIVESLQIKSKNINSVSGNMILYRLREDNVPIIPVYKAFNISADNTELDNALLVVVESDGRKVGLLVDDLLAQQQVVIKSLEGNYKRVEGISGATILGDGSVALILDISGLMHKVANQKKKPKRAA